MKYTRYDYKRKKDNKPIFLLIFLSIILAAVVIGSGISNIFIKKPSNEVQNQNKPAQNQSNSQNNNQSGDNGSYQVALIQSGVFSNKDNAEQRKGKLKEVTNPFSVEEEGKIRIYAGIYEVSQADAVMNTLNEKGIEKFRFVYEIPSKDKSTQYISKVIEGHLKILAKLSEKDVNSVITDDFKKWVEAIKVEDENNDNVKLLDEYKNYINSLPKELGKEKVEENYLYIYNIMKKIAVKK